jgi:YHS domain-containing protein
MSARFWLTTLAYAGIMLTRPLLAADDHHRADSGHGEHKTEAGKEHASEPAKPGVKAYPLDTCIVSGEKLGEMGKPVVFEYKGQEIKLCCKSCRKKFDKDPAKFLTQMEQKAKKPAAQPATPGS